MNCKICDGALKEDGRSDDRVEWIDRFYVCQECGATHTRRTTYQVQSNLVDVDEFWLDKTEENERRKLLVAEDSQVKEINQMVKCPSCGENIDHLILYERLERSYKVTMVGRGLDFVQWRPLEEIDGEDAYACPACHNELCNHDDEALQLLSWVENNDENRVRLARAVLVELDAEEVLGLAVDMRGELYARDDEGFHADWAKMFGAGK